MSLGLISPVVAKQLGLVNDCAVMAGTTDSIAAFLASGASQPGQAVSSLGSTLALKALSTVPVEDAARGIYSHRLGPSQSNLDSTKGVESTQWLVGGASNVGCAIFRAESFSDNKLSSLSVAINRHEPCELDYYPLLGPGERFPVNDPLKQPVLEPKPKDRKVYLQGLLHSLARIEAQGYAALEQLGATPVTEVRYD